MIFAGYTCQEFEGFIHNNKCASIIRAQIVDTFGERELPKLGTQKLHGLKLGLKLNLHISGKQINSSLAKLPAY